MPGACLVTPVPECRVYCPGTHDQARDSTTWTFHPAGLRRPLAHLRGRFRQELRGPLEHLVPAVADPFDRRSDLDVGNESHALELTAVGVADVVAAEGDDDVTWEGQGR